MLLALLLAIPVFSHEDPIHACPLDAAAPIEAIVANGPPIPVLARENTEIDDVLRPGNLEPYRAGHWKTALFLADGVRERYHPLAEPVAKGSSSKFGAKPRKYGSFG